jgi:histidinol-phosphate/aromatic aminotransferase/cobyric acid decarboxylase-like protein/choline kinase
VKAIILAAGYGRRMQPLTNAKHKTLLPIAGSTILRRIMESLDDNGVHDVCIVTGYRDEELRRYVLENFGHLHLEFIHNPQYATTNNVFSMSLALDAIDISDDIILIESDLIFDPAVLAQLIASPHPNAALLDRYHTGLDGTVVSLTASGTIAQVYPPHLQPEGFDYSDKYKTLNIYRFEKDFCRTSFRQLLSFYSRVFDTNSYYELMLGVLIYVQAAAVHGVLVEHPWAEVDDPNDLTGAEFTFDTASRREIVESSWGGYWSLPHVDYAFIRNMHFPTPAMFAELRANLPQLLQNYGSSQQILNRKLAYFESCDEAHTIALNGASQAFPILGSLFEGARVALPDPTFGEYHRAFPTHTTYPDPHPIDPAHVAQAAAASDVVVVVNPNNPTGSLLSTDFLLEVIQANGDTTFIVDESFIEFSREPSLQPLIDRHELDNVVLVKSLSKTIGVPGVRIGYVYTRIDAVKQAFSDALPVWNMNSVAENLLEILLKNRRALEQSFLTTIADRESFAEWLTAVPVVDHVYPSGANFLLVRLSITPAQADRLLDELMTHHLVHLKDVSSKVGGPLAHLRLAVRTPAENQALCALLTEVA